jgi:hypothetical protein
MKAIHSINYLAQATIRQLKSMCSGKGISKLMWGKVWSNMTKAELIIALRRYFTIIAACPQKAAWSLLQHSKRISAQWANAECWVSYIGCRTEQEAYKMLQWLLDNRCEWALVRKSKRSEFPLELKVWGMPRDLLRTLVLRDRASAI